MRGRTTQPAGSPGKQVISLRRTSERFQFRADEIALLRSSREGRGARARCRFGPVLVDGGLRHLMTFTTGVGGRAAGAPPPRG